MSKKIVVTLLAGVIAMYMAAPSVYCETLSPSAPGIDSTNCSTCHDKQVKSLTDSTMHASVHAKKGIGECTICHDPEALKTSHANVKPGAPNFVKPRRYPKEFCLKCHGTYADLAKRTAGSKTLTDLTGHVFNPHDLPKPPKHEDNMDECSNCHKEHKKNPAVAQYCGGCHHTGEYINCNTCHE